MGFRGAEGKRGAKSIRIVAPVLKPGDVSSSMRFTQVKVYDISDTDGPSLDVPTLAPEGGQEERVDRLLVELEGWVRGSGLTLLYEAPVVNRVVDGATNGVTIWVRPDLGSAERAIVLAHEIAHVKMHFRRKQRGQVVIIDEPGEPRSRDARELEAELTAFLMLEQCGIDSTSGSVSGQPWECDEIGCRALGSCG